MVLYQLLHQDDDNKNKKLGMENEWNTHLVEGNGITDINGHALDLRSMNSWTSKLEPVSTPEVVECMFVLDS